MNTSAKPLPEPTDLARPFWEALRRNELRLQQCSACSFHIHPPKIICPRCHGRQLEWQPVAPRGRVYSYTVVHRPPMPAFAKDVPYAVALVDIEGTSVRLLSNLYAPLDSIHVGMPVELVFDHGSEQISLFRFRPVHEAASTGGTSR